MGSEVRTIRCQGASKRPLVIGSLHAHSHGDEPPPPFFYLHGHSNAAGCSGNTVDVMLLYNMSFFCLLCSDLIGGLLYTCHLTVGEVWNRGHPSTEREFTKPSAFESSNQPKEPHSVNWGWPLQLLLLQCSGARTVLPEQDHYRFC